MACVLSTLGIVALAVLTLVVGFGSVVDPGLTSGSGGVPAEQYNEVFEISDNQPEGK